MQLSHLSIDHECILEVTVDWKEKKKKDICTTRWILIFHSFNFTDSGNESWMILMFEIWTFISDWPSIKWRMATIEIDIMKQLKVHFLEILWAFWMVNRKKSDLTGFTYQVIPHEESFISNSILLGLYFSDIEVRFTWPSKPLDSLGLNFTLKACDFEIV